MSGYYTYELAFFGAMLLAILATPVVTYAAKRMRLVDEPGLRKVHAAAIPRIGGAAIVFATFAATLPALALDNCVGEAFRQDQMQLMAIFVGGLFMFAIGLIDDVRHLRPRTKLFAQLSAAAMVCLSGVRLDAIVVDPLFRLELGWLSWPLTMLWIVGVTNALNLIDGLDGLAAGIGVVASGVIAAFAIQAGQPITAVLMLAMLGSLLGFLFLNFNPARIFMGDCGSLFLGFVIAASSIRSTQKAGTIAALAMAALALGVPILDTLLSITRRVIERRGIFSGDRGHIHHRLLDKGLKQRQVAMVVYFATLVAAGMGMFMLFVRGWPMVGIFGLTVMLLLLAFHAAGAIRLREALVKMGSNRRLAAEIAQQRKEYDTAALIMRDRDGFEEWWQAVGKAAKELRLQRLQLHVVGRDGMVRTHTWCGEELVRPGQERIDMVVPVRRSSLEGPLRMEVEAVVNGSIESAGRRIGLFCRLLDEYDIGRERPELSAKKT